jgi:hypothetical protein
MSHQDLTQIFLEKRIGTLDQLNHQTTLTNSTLFLSFLSDTHKRVVSEVVLAAAAGYDWLPARHFCFPLDAVGPWHQPFPTSKKS